MGPTIWIAWGEGEGGEWQKFQKINLREKVRREFMEKRMPLPKIDQGKKFAQKSFSHSPLPQDEMNRP